MKIQKNQPVQNVSSIHIPYQQAAEDSATKAMVSFSYPTIGTIGDVTIKTGPGVYFNSAYPWNWVMGFNNASYVQMTTHLSKEDLTKNWFLNIKQLSSIAGPNNYSPIAIDLNGKRIVDHFNPHRDAWMIDHFQLPDELLEEGENTIVIRLQDALTRYWIENLSLTADKPEKIWLMDHPKFGK